MLRFLRISLLIGLCMSLILGCSSNKEENESEEKEEAFEQYSHLAHFKYKSIEVAAGDNVKQGDKLGLVGNSGNSSELHIHFHVADSPNGEPHHIGAGILYEILTSTLSYLLSFSVPSCMLI